MGQASKEVIPCSYQQVSDDIIALKFFSVSAADEAVGEDDNEGSRADRATHYSKCLTYTNPLDFDNPLREVLFSFLKPLIEPLERARHVLSVL